MKNGILVPVGLVSVLGLSIFTWGSNSNQIKNTVKEVVKIEERHNEDIKEIKKDLRKIPAIEANVKHIMSEQKVMRTDIKEILRAVK